MNLQLFGGRGAGSSLGGGGGGVTDYDNKGHIVQYAKDHPDKAEEIGEYVKAINMLHDTGEFKNVADQINDMFVATVKRGRAMAFYGREAGMAINEKYLDTQAMNKAYDDAVATGFHPSRGGKSGVFAVMTHELGHAVTDRIAQQRGTDIDGYARDVVTEVTRKLGVNAKQLASKISGYAKHSDAECIAEAVADVRCNGRKASKESREIYKILKRDYKA